VPPDTTAAIFWLKNRRKNEWRDHHEHEHSGSDRGPIETRDVSDIEAVRLISRLLTKTVAATNEAPPCIESGIEQNPSA
jgi:hypothetical protein